MQAARMMIICSKNKQTNNLDFKDNDDGGRGICRWCPDGSRWVEWRNLCRAPAGQREVE